MAADDLPDVGQTNAGAFEFLSTANKGPRVMDPRSGGSVKDGPFYFSY
jgi:hypothetical protein